MSRIFSLISGETRGKGKFEAARPAIFSTIAPECINYAQYITIKLYKGREGKNLRFPEEIFAYILIFGRDKIEIFVKIEQRTAPGSESSPQGNIGNGKSKKRAKKVLKYVIIFV
jgi:hypothetical protein